MVRYAGAVAYEGVRRRRLCEGVVLPRVAVDWPSADVIQTATSVGFGGT